MKQRNPIVVILLTVITLGIYGIVWTVKTKLEMNRLGAKIPTAWLLVVPLVNIWWLWKYSEGVEQVTGGKISAILAFVLQFLLGIIGSAIIQNEFNKVGDTVAAAQAPTFTEAAPGFSAPVEATVAPAVEAPQPTVSAPEVSTAPTPPVAGPEAAVPAPEDKPTQV